MTPEEAFLDIKQLVDEHRNFVQSYKSDLGLDPEHQLWIRGEAEQYPSTTSTMARALNSLDHSSEFKLVQLPLYRMWVYTKTRNFLYLHHRDIFDEFKDSWDYPFFMQHYGIPSPLIDFTPSLEASLFFATLEADKLKDNETDEKCPVLWLFDPNTFNYYERDRRSISKMGGYEVGAGKDGNFYDFMVFGGNWGEEDSYNDVIYNASAFTEGRKFRAGISSAVSPHSETRFASNRNIRLHQQTGYFFYTSNQFQELEDAILKAFNKLEIRFRGKVETIQKRLLKKVPIDAQKAKLIKTYLESKGYSKERYALDKDLEGFDKAEFTYKKYIEETEGGYSREHKRTEFISKYIAPLEIWLDK